MPFPRIGPTSQRTKTMSYVKKASAEPPLVQSPKGALHTMNHTPLLTLAPNKSKMYTNLVFFNSVTSSRMTPSGNIVWSSIFDPTTFLYISLRLQIPCTCGLPTSYLSNTSNRRHLWNPIKYLWWNFFAEIVNMLRPLAFFAEGLHHGCLTRF